jgi:long-chain acyl-CoA synthetase
LATVLFNHDVTVILYFAAWLSGCTVVPINVEEAQEKKRFILEHSEAAAVCCWHSDVEELKELQCDLPSLRQVIAVSKEGLLNTSEPGGKKVQSPSFASGSL